MVLQVVEVNQLIKQFSQMVKWMKMMQGGGSKQIMDMMQRERRDSQNIIYYR